jgi:hypothetical protein
VVCSCVMGLVGDHLLHRSRSNPNLVLCITRRGGHLGFVGWRLGAPTWADRAAFEWLQLNAQLAARAELLGNGNGGNAGRGGSSGGASAALVSVVRTSSNATLAGMLGAAGK